MLKRIKIDALVFLVKENKLRVTIDANKKIVNFLDATLDLKNNAYYPYMKKGNVPIYVNTKSNHPPYVLAAIPKGVNKRLSSISSNDDDDVEKNQK